MNTPEPDRRAIDLNADAGEGFDSPELFAAISSANIACGGHAGDTASMRAAIGMARACGLAIGAHPGYDDRANFGRLETGDPAAAVGASVRRQVARLADLGGAAGVPLAHVKPHGALYHRVSLDLAAARALVEAVMTIDPGLTIVGFPGSELLLAAGSAGLRTVAEGFADRRYGGDGRLVSRKEKNAQLGEPEAIAQALQLAQEGTVATICLHSDADGASATATALRRALEADSIVVRPFAAARVLALPEVRVVGAAILEAGKVFLTRRSPRMSMPGKWEFPGGKIEPGEAAHAALMREIAEELGLVIEVGERIGRGTAIHAGRRIVLEVFAARTTGGALLLHEHEEHGWFDGASLAQLDWPAADLPILPALVRRLGTAE